MLKQISEKPAATKPHKPFTYDHWLRLREHVCRRVPELRADDVERCWTTAVENVRCRLDRIPASAAQRAAVAMAVPDITEAGLATLTADGAETLLYAVVLRPPPDGLRDVIVQGAALALALEEPAPAFERRVFDPALANLKALLVSRKVRNANVLIGRALGATRDAVRRRARRARWP